MPLETAQARWSKLCLELQERSPDKLLDLRLFDAGFKVELTQLSDTRLRRSPDSAPSYDMGCIQTLLEAIAIELLVQQGTLEPDAAIGFYLPELASSDSHAPGNRIRVRDALSHATGYHLPRSFDGNPYDLNDLAAFFRSHRPSFPPGPVCSWNSLGRYILEALVKKVTGKALGAVVEMHLRDFVGTIANNGRNGAGWMTAVLSLDELMSFVMRTIAPGAPGSALLSRLPTGNVPVVRRPVSARSAYPIAYSYGIPLFADGLWGQNGLGPGYALGIRFDPAMSLVTSLAVEGSAYYRDAIFRKISKLAGLARVPGLPGSAGALVSCDVSQIEGAYFADEGSKIVVKVNNDAVNCEVYIQGKFVTDLTLRLGDDDILLTDSGWEMFQIEFFPHPNTGIPCLTLGQVAYAQSDPANSGGG
jgi:hypothetical protein